MMGGMSSDQKPLTVKELAAMGGNARAASLTKKDRSAIAAKAAEARWGPKKKAAKKTAEGKKPR
jgi:hypothetical protein